MMLELIDRVLIHAPAKSVWDALVRVFSSTEGYRAWNRDHISCTWKKGRDFAVGSVMDAEEYLHGKPHRMTFAITRSTPPHGFQYTMGFPFSLACTGGSFRILPEGDAVVLEAGLFFRFKSLINLLVKKRKEDLLRHMREEGLALKEMAENAGTAR
jgi:hypothetical protein